MTTTITTTNDNLSKREFNARIVAFIGKREISRYNAAEPTSCYRFDHVLADMSRLARYNEEEGISSRYEPTIYGLKWAIDTGRCNAQTVLALRKMSVRELIALVYELHTTCANMGEYARYLMAKYTTLA